MNTTPFRLLTGGAIAALIAAVALCCAASASNSQMVVFDFTGGVDGYNAATGVAFDSANNAYVTEVQGGLNSCGTIDKLVPASQGLWSEQTLWPFTCGADGKNPHGGVTLDAVGNLYGTTVAGGSGGSCTGDGCGVVFRLSTRGVLTAIYNFTGGNDGYGPGNPVVFDTHGNLYGDAPDGGRHGAGVVYRLSPLHPNHWRQTVIHAFTGGRDGGVGSLGPLLIDANGTVYGVAEIGGAHQAGTVFKIVPGANNSWTFTVLYAFKGMPDAAFPYGGLIADSHGDLFGTTYYGGAGGNGAVYELKLLSTGSYREHVIYSFAGGSDGANPTTTLIFDKSGNLWGTTSSGGACQCGTIFKISGTTETVVHQFGSTTNDGQFPYYGFSFGPNGALFTSTVQGGTFGGGTIYGVMP